LATVSGKSDGAPLRNENAVDAGAFGGAKYGPEISRVFDSIEQQQQRTFADAVKYLVRRDIVRRGNDGGNALVVHLAAG
jgi:hypothetical protein